jgi:hypothetical protein
MTLFCDDCADGGTDSPEEYDVISEDESDDDDKGDTTRRKARPRTPPQPEWGGNAAAKGCSTPKRARGGERADDNTKGEKADVKKTEDEHMGDNMKSEKRDNPEKQAYESTGEISVDCVQLEDEPEDADLVHGSVQPARRLHEPLDVPDRPQEEERGCVHPDRDAVEGVEVGWKSNSVKMEDELMGYNVKSETKGDDTKDEKRAYFEKLRDWEKQVAWLFPPRPSPIVDRLRAIAAADRQLEHIGGGGVRGWLDEGRLWGEPRGERGYNGNEEAAS